MSFRKNIFESLVYTGGATDVLHGGGDGFVDRHDVSDYSTVDVQRGRRNDFTFS